MGSKLSLGEGDPESAWSCGGMASRLHAPLYQQGTEVRGSLLLMAPTLSGNITQAAPGTLSQWFSKHTSLLQVACDHTQDSPGVRCFPVEPTEGEAQRVGSGESRYVSGSFM